MDESNEKDFNKEFLEDVKEMDEAPIISQEEAFKVLLEFSKKKFHDFWEESAKKYFPAIKAGVMLLERPNDSHDNYFHATKELLNKLNYDELCDAFIYSIETGDLKYRTAICAYHILKTIPNHEFFNVEGKSHMCSVCKWSDIPDYFRNSKMRFFWANYNKCLFYFEGRFMGSNPNIENCNFILSEYLKLPKVKPTLKGWNIFKQVLLLSKELLPTQKIGAYKKIIIQKRILPLQNSKKVANLLDLLGYLNVLHSKNELGFSKKFVPFYEQKDPVEHKNDYAYPVCHWRASDGVDYVSLKEVFGNVNFKKYFEKDFIL